MHPVFAKKKRSVFKGPSIGNTPGQRGRTSGGSSNEGSRSTSIQGRTSAEITIAEEDEEEEEDAGGYIRHHVPRPPSVRLSGMQELQELDEELEVEEVEAFSPVEEGTSFIVEEDEDEVEAEDTPLSPSPKINKDAIALTDVAGEQNLADAEEDEESETRRKRKSEGLGISGAGASDVDQTPSVGYDRKNSVV